MNKLFIFLSGCILMGHGNAALADMPPFIERPEVTNRLLLSTVVSEIESNNPVIKSAQSVWEAMKERVTQAKAWEDPRAEVDLTAGRFVEVMPDSFPDQRFMLEQMLPLSGKNRFRGNAATAEAFIAFQELRRRKLDALNSGREAYYMLANEYKQLELNRQNAELWVQIITLTRHKYQTGLLGEADVLRAETERAKLDESRFDIERNISEAETKLNTVMGHGINSVPGKPVEMVFKPQSYSLEQTIALALSCRPEMLMARGKIQAAQARRASAKREWIPDPGFKVEADRYNGGRQVISEISAGISFSLPWFNRSKYRAGINESQKMLESAEQDLESERLQTIGMVRDQLKSIETFHHHTELFQSNLLPLARQTAAASRIGYETDKSGILDILNAQREVQEIESMYWDHLAHYLIAEAHLEEMVGATQTSGSESSPTQPHHHDSQ